jgi:hypothetical protein
MPDDNLRYLTADEKNALTLWRTKLEAALAVGGEVYNELMFWLAPMGGVYSGGQLNFPSSRYYTRAAPWTNIEKYFNGIHSYCVRYFGGSGFAAAQVRTYINETTYNGSAAYVSLKAAYPARSHILAVLDGLYNRVDAVLARNGVAYPDRQTVIGGMLVLFETFAVWGSKIWDSDYHLSTAWAGGTSSGTVGPYVVSVNYCENGVIFGITMEEATHTAHQSVDAELWLQNEAQKTLGATENISANQAYELDTDIALQAVVTKTLPATECLLGSVQKPLKSYLALRDRVDTNLPASGNLANLQYYEVTADERLALDKHMALDASCLIHGPVRVFFAARMLLIPDSAAQIKVDLKKYHDQQFRVVFDPISYNVYNSETDTEVQP